MLTIGDGSIAIRHNNNSGSSCTETENADTFLLCRVCGTVCAGVAQEDGTARGTEATPRAATVRRGCFEVRRLCDCNGGTWHVYCCDGLE